jgi:glutamate-1-semialdehyde 2,1-aminomutase
MNRWKIDNSESAKAFIQACRSLVGGVNSPVRAFGGLDTKPVFIASAKGSKIYDIDGNEYIDYVCSWGPMILGHAHAKVLKAVRAAAKSGTSFGASTLAETQLAEKIVSAFESIEKVRLVSSGTEAVMTAVRLARAFTKRDFIIKMAGCYHGHSDSLLVAAGSGVAERGMASSAGVPEALARLTIVIPYNDIDAAKVAFKKHKDKIAAILVEPVAANMGVVPPVDGYLQGLRSLCDENKTLLIFDEVITGFRIAFGGAQERFGLNADITCLGKIIGGGLPTAAVGGKADIMDMLAPLGPVYQAGTLSGNPIAMGAANATLELLDARCWTLDSSPFSRGQACPCESRGVSSYEYLESRAAMLEEGLVDAAKQAGVSVTINRIGSIMSCFFTDKPVRNFADVQSTDIKKFKKFFAQMLKRGIYLAPSAYEAMFISLAHTKRDIKKTIKTAEQSFRKVKD